MSDIEQLIFDTTAKHLHDQGGPAVRMVKNHGTQASVTPECRYRTLDGKRMCSVGLWIAPEKYESNLENQGATDTKGEDETIVFWVSTFEQKVSPIVRPFPKLMRELQRAHDYSQHIDGRWNDPWEKHTFRVKGIANSLEIVAKAAGLKPNILYTLWPKGCAQ